MSSIVRFFPFLLILPFVFQGCGKRERTVDFGVENQILHIANYAEPQVLDPHTISGGMEDLILINLFEGLIVLDSKTLEPLPASAESWEVLDDKLSWIFHLRKDLRWSNSDPLNARDFLYGFKRAISPAIAGPFEETFKGITNAIPYKRGEVLDFEQVGYKLIDDYTIEISLDFPHPALLSYLSLSTFSPIHQKTIEAAGAMDERGTGWYLPENIVSNGAFIFKEWETNSVLTLEPNDFYYAREMVRLNRVHYFPIEDQGAQYRAYQSGQVHVTYKLPDHQVEQFEKSPIPGYRRYQFFCTNYYLFNLDRPPLNDVRVRQALSIAIDREVIVSRVVSGGKLAASSFVPPGVSGYVSETKLETQVQEARRLLAEAGYPDGKGFPVLKLLFNSLDDHKKVGEAVQQMWRTQLGIDIELYNMEWKVYLDTKTNGDFDIVRVGYISGDDPQSYFEYAKADFSFSDKQWSSLAFNQFLYDANYSLNPEDRLKNTQKAENILIDEAIVSPLYYYTRNRMVDPRVKNWNDNPMDYVLLKDVYLEE